MVRFGSDFAGDVSIIGTGEKEATDNDRVRSGVGLSIYSLSSTWCVYCE